MLRIYYFLTLFVLIAHVAAAEQEGFSLFSRSDEIQKEIDAVEEELNSLPLVTLTHLPWNLGFQSSGSPNRDKLVTIEINLEDPQPIDLIVLMPAVTLDEHGKHAPLGFPEKFLLEAVKDDGETEIIADHRTVPYRIQDIGPQLFKRDEQSLITKIRLLVTELKFNELWGQGDYRMALSEIMAFRGEDNIAISKGVRLKGSGKKYWRWHIEQINDGFIAFSPVDQRVPGQYRSHSFLVRGDEATLFFDLGEKKTINSFRLWPVASDFYSSSNPMASGHGFPMLVKFYDMTRANAPKEEWKLLYILDEGVMGQAGSTPIHRRMGILETQHVAVELSNPLIKDMFNQKEIHLAEIELLYNGVSVTSGIIPEVTAVSSLNGDVFQYNSQSLLTNSLVVEGEIIPLREWIIKAHRRFHLERKMNKLKSDLVLSELKEENFYKVLLLTFVVLIGFLVLFVWNYRLRSRQKLLETREQIASDVHDRIGGNLSSLALNQELLIQEIEEPTDTQSQLLEEAIEMAREAAEEASQIVNVFGNKTRDFSFALEVEKSAEHLLKEVDYCLELHEAKVFDDLPILQRWNLLLYVKEALHNILKHSEATKVTISSFVIDGQAQVLVEDDGKGLSDKNTGLYHLRERVKKIKGQLKVDTKRGKGVKLILTFPVK